MLSFCGATCALSFGLRLTLPIGLKTGWMHHLLCSVLFAPARLVNEPRTSHMLSGSTIHLATPTGATQKMETSFEN